MQDFSSYSSLAETSYETGKYETKEDFFHSIFISGKNREVENGIIQKSGKMQIRNIVNNLDEIHMIITHTKQVLVKQKNVNKRNILECFSFQNGNKPFKGMSGNICGRNSAERAANQFCNTCKAQIIAAGIYCDENGKPITDNDGKPIFIFVRGSGSKYAGIADYLNELSNIKDLDPVFTPVTPESSNFEKLVVNNKRFVTKITIQTIENNYGETKVFKLEAGDKIPKDTVLKILDLTKKTSDKFVEKFDWSKNKNNANSFNVSSDQQFSSQNNIQNTNNQKEVSEEAKPITEDLFDFSNISSF